MSRLGRAMEIAVLAEGCQDLELPKPEPADQLWGRKGRGFLRHDGCSSVCSRYE